MRFSKVAALAAVSAVTNAADNSTNSTSLCDKYTTALLTTNNATNQLTLLTLLVNTVVIGNYTKPNIPGITFPNISVPGILKKGTVNGAPVDLLPYFDGGLASTNRGGQAVSVNFLDDGGATPLMQNMPAMGTSSNQYFLLTHLYQYFGSALGCSAQGNGSAFSAYQGTASQYSVHKFMALDTAQVTYFITQVGLAAASFGVSEADIKTVGGLLDATFNRRCAAPMTLIPASAGPQLQAICVTNDCQIASNASCASYDAVIVPGVANSTLADGLGNSSNTATASASGGGVTSMPSMTATGTAGTSGSATGTKATGSPGAAVKNVAGAAAAGALGLAAFFL